MRRNYLMAGIMLAAAALSLSACNSKTEETLAYETATAPETEEAKETEAEETTIDASEYETAESLETWFMFEKFAKEKLNYITSEMPPEIGEAPRTVGYIADHQDGDKLIASTDVFKSVTLPEWGIKKLAVQAALFPESEENVRKLDSSKVIKRTLTAEEVAKLNSCGNTDVSESTEVLDYDGIYMDWSELTGTEPDEICVDISELYPGSFSRAEKWGMIQLFNKKTDIELTPDAIGDMTSAELFEKLYPYGSYRFGTENESGIDDFNIFDYNDCKYIWWPVSMSSSRLPFASCPEDNLYGIMFMRVKGGLCEGILYMTPDEEKNEAVSVYCLGRCMELYDISLDRERLCEDYLGR